MPGAEHHRSVEDALAQRASPVKADVRERVEGAADVEERDGPAPRHDLAAAPGANSLASITRTNSDIATSLPTV